MTGEECYGCKIYFEYSWLFNRENGFLCSDCFEKGIVIPNPNVLALEALREGFNELNSYDKVQIIAQAKRLYEEKYDHIPESELKLLKEISLKNI